MDEITPDIIEQTPRIKGKVCKIYLLFLYVFLTYTPLLLGLIIWYFYGFFIGLAFYLFFTLMMGIIISKLRLTSLPPYQREMSYSNMAVARWFLGKNICF